MKIPVTQTRSLEVLPWKYALRKKTQSETQASCLNFPRYFLMGVTLLSAGCHLLALFLLLFENRSQGSTLFCPGLSSRNCNWLHCMACPAGFCWVICDVLLLDHLSLVIFIFTLPCYVLKKPTHSKLKIQPLAHSPDRTEQASPRGRKSGL